MSWQDTNRPANMQTFLHLAKSFLANTSFYMTKHPLSPDPGYYTNYILMVPEGNILQQLEIQMTQTVSLLEGISEEKGLFAYAPGKWSIKELIGHILDCERVFAYRAMRYSRNDKTPLPSFEEDEYVANAFFNNRTMKSLIEEYILQRKSSIAFFKNLNEEELNRTGTANNKVLSVIQLLYIIAGHELHHVGVLKERYMIADSND